jgi:hypothetical protein
MKRTHRPASGFLVGACMLLLLHHPAHGQAGREDLTTPWLPFGNGLRATCIQGANSTGTHRGVFAWDFMLDEGRPVVAAQAGRVIQVIDDRVKTGFNSFEESNRIVIDHGGGVLTSYLHHRTASARVAPGQLVAAGTHLADVGKVGTYVPHICFSVRGPSYEETHDVRFQDGGRQPVEIREGRRYTSTTPRPEAPLRRFTDSILHGEEFRAAGVWLRGGRLRAYVLAADSPLAIEGEVTRDARTVGFYLWRDGQRSEYVATAVPDSRGRFRLAIRIPAASRGARWYRIAVQEPTGRILDGATLPALVE